MNRQFILILAILTILFSGWAGLVQAQDRSAVWERYDVELTVQKNGAIDIVETQTIQFQGGPFRFGFATIPLKRLEGITNVEIYEGDQPYTQNNSESPYTFQTWIENGEFNIRWYFPETSDSTHTFVFKYTAQGAIRIYEDGDQLWWTVIEDPVFPIRSSQVTVHLPAETKEIQLWDAYGVQAESQLIDPQTVVFTAAETIDPGEIFEVRVQFPHGVIEAPPPAWQLEFDAQVPSQGPETIAPSPVTSPRDSYQSFINLLAGFIGLLITIGGIVGLFVLWYTRGRDAPVPLVADYLPRPPSDLPPGVVGTLLDERADLQDIIATIVDLARRNIITMQELQKRGFLGIGNRRDFVFELHNQNATLRPYEKTLLHHLFKNGSQVKLSSLKEKFYQVIPELEEELYEEVVREGFFHRSPQSTRRMYTILGGVGVFLSVFAGIFSVSLSPVVGGGILCIPMGLAVVSIGLMIFARIMPRKTPKGAEAATQWNAFKRYLENIEKYTDLEQAKDIFDQYLPYAIAFGLEQSWVRKFAEVDAPAPPWYQPAGPVWHEPWPRPVRRYPGPRPVIVGGGRPGDGHPRPEVSPGETGRDVELPDLQRTSDSLGRGLQDMSDGLATLLNVAGTILSSAPRSSGGRSSSFGGGWSGGGGGFSGGGGGGSGGGSRGFG